MAAPSHVLRVFGLNRHPPLKERIMELGKEWITVPLCSLVPSPDNVRRHATGHIEELAALIDAQGLLQNLVVTAAVTGRRKSRAPQFAVAAGERRRRAMLLLHKRGRLAADHEVRCELVSAERGLEISLAENSGREPMHPADEFEAFQALIAEGKGIEDVAARFGVPPLVVRRRLKLASLSPRLIALYREGAVNLDQLMALSLTEDHALQEHTWFEAQPWNRTPLSLRRTLTADDIEVRGNALVRFVGVENYEAAGGAVRRDLFDDCESGFLTDPALLRSLAHQRLDALADGVRTEGWRWVEARLDLDSAGLREFSVSPSATRRTTSEQRTELSELVVRERELRRQSAALRTADEFQSDEAECIHLELDDISGRRNAIRETLASWSPDARASAGAIVTVGREGDPEIIRGLVRELDRKGAKAAAEGRRKGRGNGGALGEQGAPASDGPSASTESKGAGHSDSLVRRLMAHRTVALQALLAQNIQVALAALVDSMFPSAIDEHVPARRASLQITVQSARHRVLGAADDVQGSRAWAVLAARREGLCARVPKNSGERFEWLISLPQAELLDLLALCVALSLDAVTGRDEARRADDIARAVGLSMSDWWDASADGYLRHVSKAHIGNALKEAGCDFSEREVAGLKKDALVTLAASRLAGTSWLPPQLRASVS